VSNIPALKVFDSNGKYQASVKDKAAAAALMAFYGAGASIRYNGHSKKNIVWTEGSEQECAHHSYDAVVETISDRIAERQARFFGREVPS